MILKADNHGSPFVGLYALVTDNHAVVPKGLSQPMDDAIKQLGVDIIRTGIANTQLPGLFAAASNKLLVTTKLIDRDELRLLSDVFPDVIVIEANFTAVGNLVAMNDRGIVCAPQLAAEIKGAVGCRVAASDLVGSSVFATNRGFMAHPEATDEELAVVQKTLGVEGGTGTVNFGDPLASTGLIGNSKGIIAGSRTSGPEMNRIDDIFILEQ